MPYNLNMENIIIHNKTRDMLPSISKSVQSSPIWRFLFVDNAEIGTVSILSSHQNKAYIGCRLKPETLTDLTQPILHKLTYIHQEFGNNAYGVNWWGFYCPNVIFAMNEAHNFN